VTSKRGGKKRKKSGEPCEKVTSLSRRRENGVRVGGRPARETKPFPGSGLTQEKSGRGGEKKRGGGERGGKKEGMDFSSELQTTWERSLEGGGRLHFRKR